MIFFSLTLILGFCAIFNSAQGSFFTAYGLDNDSKVAYQPSKISDAVNGHRPFVFQLDYFKKADADYFNKDFVLVYRPTDDADHLVAFLIKGGFKNLFKKNDRNQPYEYKTLKKDLLSEEHYGLTPAMADIFGKEFFDLPVFGVNTEVMNIMTIEPAVYQEIPFLYMVPRNKLGDEWMIKDARQLGQYDVTDNGISQSIPL